MTTSTPPQGQAETPPTTDLPPDEGGSGDDLIVPERSAQPLFRPESRSLAATLLAPAKERSYAALQLRAGQSVLEVGCGPGIDTLALAELVGETGFVMGVDSAKAFVETAERRALAAGVGARVRHRIVNALSLPFRNSSFDACRSERTFQMLAQPQLALAEMARVTRPGGRIVVLDTDWGSASIDSPLADVERLLKRLLVDHLIPSPFSGRTLYRLLRTQGLNDVEIVVIPVAVHSLTALRQLTHLDRCEAMALERAPISEQKLAAWRGALAEAEAANALFASINMVLAAGNV